MTDALLTDDDLAAWLKLSKTTLRNLRYQRRVPFLKLAGGAVRYRREDIEAWIEQGVQPAVPQLAAVPSRRRRSG